ncbi:MAG: hypothetical protein QW512_04025 [Thermofilaceae archaeon]
MNQHVLARLMQSFASASLADKVLLAASLHYAKHKDERIVEEAKNAWMEAVKLEVELQYVVDLYRRGLADYTSLLQRYTDIAEFIVRVLGEALS